MFTWLSFGSALPSKVAQFSVGANTVGALLEQVPLSQSALSQHLARMRDEGLLTFRREAQTLYYRIGNPDVAKLIATLKTIFCA
mgnify:CR=1 FL=1